MPLEDKPHIIPSVLPHGQPIKLHWRVLYTPSLFLLASLFGYTFFSKLFSLKKDFQLQHEEWQEYHKGQGAVVNAPFKYPLVLCSTWSFKGCPGLISTERRLYCWSSSCLPTKSIFSLPLPFTDLWNFVEAIDPVMDLLFTAVIVIFP